MSTDIRKTIFKKQSNTRSEIIRLAQPITMRNLVNVSQSFKDHDNEPKEVIDDTKNTEIMAPDKHKDIKMNPNDLLPIYSIKQKIVSTSKSSPAKSTRSRLKPKSKSETTPKRNLIPRKSVISTTVVGDENNRD